MLSIQAVQTWEVNKKKRVYNLCEQSFEPLLSKESNQFLKKDRNKMHAGEPCNTHQKYLRLFCASALRFTEFLNVQCSPKLYYKIFAVQTVSSEHLLEVFQAQ